MPIKILRPCKPGPLGSCSDPLAPTALASIVESLPITAKEGNVNLLIPGQVGISLLPRLANTITGVVAHPDNKKYGLFHLPEIKTRWINSATLQKIVDWGLSISGNYYYHLVYSINAIGLEALNIEYILPDD